MKTSLDQLDKIVKNKKYNTTVSNCHSNLTKCVALEQIFSINAPYLVAPFLFTRNVLQYQASQSRICTDLNGKLGPGDCYKTITNWLTSQSTSLVAFPVCDS